MGGSGGNGGEDRAVGEKERERGKVANRVGAMKVHESAERDGNMRDTLRVRQRCV